VPSRSIAATEPARLDLASYSTTVSADRFNRDEIALSPLNDARTSPAGSAVTDP
jgi:hypothetical protein